MPGKRQGNVYTGMLQIQAGGRREAPFVHLSGLKPREGREVKKEVAESIKDHNGRVLSSSYTTSCLSVAAALRNKAEQNQRPHPHQSAVAGSDAVE
jgi:hypothetical protein